jgi:hypothetical protein
MLAGIAFAKRRAALAGARRFSKRAVLHPCCIAITAPIHSMLVVCRL